MSGINITVEGSDAVARQLAIAPKEMEKAIKTAMRKASREPLRRVKTSVPNSGWAKSLTVKAVVKKKKTEIQLSAGIFGKPRNGNEIPAWFLAYWTNYGTLSKRDAMHKFKYEVKKIKRKNNTGQAPMRFFENATTNAAREIANAVIRAAEETAEKLESKING